MKNTSYLIALKEFSQPNGTLSVIEGDQTLPFSICRCFFIYDLKPGDIRGNHAADYEECIFLLSGECSVMVHDGNNQTVYSLKTPMEGVYIPSMFWREVYDCSSDCMLAVFSDQHYNPDAYVCDFEAFLRYQAENAVD